MAGMRAKSGTAALLALFDCGSSQKLSLQNALGECKHLLGMLQIIRGLVVQRSIGLQANIGIVLVTAGLESLIRLGSRKVNVPVFRSDVVRRIVLRRTRNALHLLQLVLVVNDHIDLEIVRLELAKQPSLLRAVETVP